MDVCLQHHGIKGQRWGVRRFQNEDGSLTNRGKARINNKDGNVVIKKVSKALQGNLRDYNNSSKISSLASLGKEAVNNKSGLKRLDKPESISEVIQNANPKYGEPDYNTNCTYCSVTSFLRSKGYDVTAKTPGLDGDNVINIASDGFIGASARYGKTGRFGKSVKDASEILVNNFGTNADGICQISYKRVHYGHAFNWSIKDGVVTFFDGQSPTSLINNEKSIHKYWKYIDTNSNMAMVRLDQAEIDKKGITKFVE